MFWKQKIDKTKKVKQFKKVNVARIRIVTHYDTFTDSFQTEKTAEDYYSDILDWYDSEPSSKYFRYTDRDYATIINREHIRELTIWNGFDEVEIKEDENG